MSDQIIRESAFNNDFFKVVRLKLTKNQRLSADMP
jgi:hypothetical protein